MDQLEIKSIYEIFTYIPVRNLHVFYINLPLPVEFTKNTRNMIDLFNPSGEACSSAATCMEKLMYSDGMKLSSAVANYANVSFQILDGDYCIQVSNSLEFAGIDCKNIWGQAICKYDCYNRK